jgi:Asp-tRNA(Asn)/Glu-tRNA(Gln) amidotransferase A subunit family amidase
MPRKVSGRRGRNELSEVAGSAAQVRLSGLPHQLRSGELALPDYLRELEARFASREPDVLAFLPEPGRFERLQTEAAALEQRFPDLAARPALFGLPVGVKDIFHVDGYPTQAGSRLPADRLAGSEARCVSRLRAQGALILGKTVTTEFAYFAPGPTRNPHSPGHTPGGSSSGSAAAVAAGLAPLALGTQTIGSIVRPAGFCGVLGFKPSRERISREGVIPLSESLDHVGFFAADLDTARAAAAALFEDWHGLPETEARPKLGVPTGPFLGQATPEGIEHFWSAVERLREAGFRVERVDALADLEDIVRRNQQLLAAEAARAHERWFAEFAERYHPRTAALIREGQQVPAAELERARAGTKELRKTLTGLMEAHGLDLWMAPSATGPAPEGLESTGNPAMNLPWTHAGLPTLSLPSGRSADGLPLGTQFIGRFGEDERLLGWAHGLEQVLGWTEAPAR